MDTPFEHLGGQPFLGRDAVRAGRLTARRLDKDFRAIYRNVYVHRTIEVDAAMRARAAWLWAGECRPIVGLSAAALHGDPWVDSRVAAEVNRADRHAPAGITIHTYPLAPHELCTVDGVRVTTAARTAFDIGRGLPLDTAIVHLDALARVTGIRADDVAAIAAERPGVRGTRRLHVALSHMDAGAESPPESRLRIALVRAGLPRPTTQIELRDRFGRVRVRLDMGWRTYKVAVEYDGAHHWTDRQQRAWDIDRLALLEESGWAVVRVSADLLDRPAVVVARVAAKLRAAGCPL